MAASTPYIVLNASAVSQHDRTQGAPAPERVLVDGRGLAQLLAFAARYGALINFYDLQDRPDGDWAAFFAADPAVAHALHASLDLPTVERLFDELLAGFRQDHDGRRRARDLKRVLESIDSLVQVLDRAHLIRGRGAHAAGGLDPRARRDGLAAPLGRLRGHLSGSALRNELGDVRNQGQDGWSVTLSDILDDVVGALMDELKQGVRDAEQAMHTSLGDGGHTPQAALYNAFVLLFMQAREAMNQFPRRLVDFYYETILDQRDLAAQPDQLFLTLTLSKPDTPGSAPRGALFSAGTDAANQPINYAAETSLDVSPATVEGLSVHRVIYAPKTGGGQGGLPTGVLRGEISVAAMNAGTGKAFPLFGAADAGAHGPLKLEPANLGFTIATPVLLAQGGRRTVEIGLVVSPQITAEATSLLQAHSQSQDASGLAATAAKVIQDSFLLHYSTAGGWVTVDSFMVSPSAAPGRPGATVFTLAFTLPPDAPPITPLSAKPDPNAPAPSLPMAAFPAPSDDPIIVGSVKPTPPPKPPPKTPMFAMALPAPALDPFPILSGMVIEDVIVDLTVEGLDALTITTANGPVDTTQTFPVLGLPPVQFGGFEIYAPELFAKAPTQLSISITWSGLPVSSTGFEGYYKGYVLDADGNTAPGPLFDNASFNVAFQVKNPGLWDVGDATAPLFATAGPAAYSASGSVPPPLSPPLPLSPAPAAPLSRVSTLRAPITHVLAEPPAYYNPAASALRVSLATPSYAFGNVLFTPNTLAAAALQTQAAIAAAKQNGGSGSAQVAHLAAANAAAPEKGYAQAIAPVVEQSVSALTGDALGAVKLAIGLSGAPVASQAAQLAGLDVALSAAPQAASLWKRLTGAAGDPAAVLGGLETWLGQHEGGFGKAAQPALARAHAALGAGKAIITTHAAAVGQPPAVAKLNMAAAILEAGAATTPPPMPNPPWSPAASTVSVSYSASTRATGQSAWAAPLGDTPSPSAQVAGPPASGPPPAALVPAAFAHVGAFGEAHAAPSTDGGGVMGLVPLVDPHAALYIQLSAQTPQITLLFILTAGAKGWWDKQPELRWEQYVGGRWVHATLLGDSTHDLANSGVVTLGLQTGAHVNPKPRVRVLALGDAENAPLVKAIVTNALTASWVGPGGAGSLGQPLPASTITKSVEPIANIGAVAQPMESFGGSPPLNGAPFQMWMAERLRHKNYGVDAWDYARLTLEGAPSLWQAIVAPALDERTGEAAPGKVWVVAVAGPKTPNVTDPTVPSVDFTALSTIGEQLKTRISPFIELAVTNPPYLRLKVTAVCVFSADDTPAFWTAKLQGELVLWLSPWPPAGLGTRPADYYTPRAVAEFVRGRPYVVGVTSLTVAPETTPSPGAYYYLTSSTNHDLQGTSPPATPGLSQARLVVGAST